MDAQVVIAIITTIGTIVVAAIGAGWVARRRGGRTGDGGLAAGWRAQAELSAARATLLEEQLEDRDRELGRLRVDLGRTQTELDNCVRQRQAALTELVGVRKRRSSGGSNR